MWKWKEEERKERVWKMHSVAQRRMSEWLGKWDGCRACVCTEARHWLELQQSSHSILHPPPSLVLCSLSLSLSLTHSLTHCISPADWGIPTSTGWGSEEFQWASPLCVRKFTLQSSSSLDPFSLDNGALSPRVRSCGFAGQSQIMDQGGAVDGQGNWVTGRFSWLMPEWTWRNGVHHQHSCVWWTAYCPREEL